MDVLALNAHSGASLVLGPTRRLDKGCGLLALRHSGGAGWRVVAGDEIAGGVLESRVSARRRAGEHLGSGGRLSIVVRGAGKKKNSDGAGSSGGNDSSVPEGDGVEESSPNDKSKPVKKPHHSLSDWRDFRANLVIQEQEHLQISDSPTKNTASHEPSQRLGPKWAHPITVPETGCVLVATEKLDGVASFERTVVLLLRLGSRDPREGPFGIILNRPLNEKIRNLKPSNPHLATTFADCSLHRGGPLDANMFLLNTGDGTPYPGFEKVVPGVCFGARNSLDGAAALVKKGVLKPRDFRFFVGYAGWQFDQLLDEIEAEYWVVAACSSHLISGTSADTSSNLWEEILQLMGGRYSELSRKPKQDSS